MPNALVPYVGTSHAIRLVIVLGAAVLLLDAAAVLAFAGRDGSSFGDGRRAAAALPLTALAVVPSTLIRPEFPYLQGLLLFALLAAFLWAERVRRGTVASALAIAVGPRLPREDATEAIANLVAKSLLTADGTGGTVPISFAGGDPTLCDRKARRERRGAGNRAASRGNII